MSAKEALLEYRVFRHSSCILTDFFNIIFVVALICGRQEDLTCQKAVRSVVQQPHLVDPIIPTRSNVNAVALAGIDPVEGPSRCDKHTRRLSGARRRACRGRVARSRKLAFAASTLLHSVPGPPVQHTRAVGPSHRTAARVERTRVTTLVDSSNCRVPSNTTGDSAAAEAVTPRLARESMQAAARAVSKQAQHSTRLRPHQA